jgi:hypothetical protein
MTGSPKQAFLERRPCVTCDRTGHQWSAYTAYNMETAKTIKPVCRGCAMRLPLPWISRLEGGLPDKATIRAYRRWQSRQAAGRAT